MLDDSGKDFSLVRNKFHITRLWTARGKRKRQLDNPFPAPPSPHTKRRFGMILRASVSSGNRYQCTAQLGLNCHDRRRIAKYCEESGAWRHHPVWGKILLRTYTIGVWIRFCSSVSVFCSGTETNTIGMSASPHQLTNWI